MQKKLHFCNRRYFTFRCTALSDFLWRIKLGQKSHYCLTKRLRSIKSKISNRKKVKLEKIKNERKPELCNEFLSVIEICRMSKTLLNTKTYFSSWTSIIIFLILHSDGKRGVTVEKEKKKNVFRSNLNFGISKNLC